MNRLFAILCVITVLTACNTVVVRRSTPVCPPPPAPPTCAPGYTDVVVYDTSRMIGNVRWSIRRVLGANTSTHEWGLISSGGVVTLITGRTPSQASYQTARIDRADVVTLTPLPNTSKAFITYIATDAIIGDASIAEAQMINGSARVTTTLPNNVNSALYWDGHPTISADGSALVFASDRPGGSGGTDLWYCMRTTNGWTNPELLGDIVNTPCDELCPQFAGDSVLLFSSAGHETVGGYDLFSTSIKFTNKTLSVGEPRNLGMPVNTKYDELFPNWHSANTLYYSSDQPTRNSTARKDFDVFVLTNATLSTPNIEDQPSTPDIPLTTDTKQPTVTVTGTVIRQDTKQPVSGAEVTATSSETNDVVAQTVSDTVGRYALNVPPGKPIDIQAQTPDLFFDKVHVDVPVKNSTVQIEATPTNDTIQIPLPLSLPSTFVLRVNFPTAVFNEPYRNVLDSNGLETSRTWQQELDQLANNVKLSGPRLKKLVLIGHTDDVDSDANNLVLGKNRVNFIMDQLVERGIERSLLEGRSAGETLLPNRRQQESIIMWRKRARRVELVKVMQE